jgi:hypothetical protein
MDTQYLIDLSEEALEVTLSRYGVVIQGLNCVWKW